MRIPTDELASRGEVARRLSPSRSFVVAVVLACSGWSGCEAPDVSPPADSGIEAVRKAFESGRSGFMVAIHGGVVRILSDDREGSRHQRFVVELDGTHTVLVSHNIDLAPRVPVADGDSVVVRGQYEWNAQGGVIHWTHADPDGRRDGGWIRHRGVTYR